MNRALLFLVCLTPLAAGLCGCTSPSAYIANRFKVGPKYETPPAPIAKDWIDANDKRIRKEDDDHSKWWTVFNDPVLNQLICTAYKQNLTLKQAGFRILQAKAQLGYSVGELFPQSQYLSGDYNRIARSVKTANAQFIPLRSYGQFDFGFNMAWEIDFWGRYRNAVQSASANLEASVFDYDDVLVTLLSEVATSYVQIRVAQQRIKYANDNVELQTKSVKVVENRQKAGVAKQLDVDQAKSVLYQTAAAVPELEIGLRVATDQLCILMGMPMEELLKKLGPAPIPIAPADVAIGVPADLLRRRPDVRRAERQAATQCPLIGVAEADFYPAISLVGTIGFSAESFKNLFTPRAIAMSVGPSFTWNILNYGRILNNVRLQDAKFKELVAAYQNTVLAADQEAENGLVMFLKAQQRAKLQSDCVKYAESAVKTVLAQYELGTVDISQLILVMQNLVPQQDTLAIAKGEIPTGLIQVFRAMGGGWQIRLSDCDSHDGPVQLCPRVAPAAEPLPQPQLQLQLLPARELPPLPPRELPPP